MEFRFSINRAEVGEIIVEADDFDQALLQAHEVYKAGGTKWGESEMSVHLERTYL